MDWLEVIGLYALCGVVAIFTTPFVIPVIVCGFLLGGQFQKGGIFYKQTDCCHPYVRPNLNYPERYYGIADKSYKDRHEVDDEERKKVLDLMFKDWDDPFKDHKDH